MIICTGPIQYIGLFTDKFDRFQFSRSLQDQHLYFFAGDKRCVGERK